MRKIIVFTVLCFLAISLKAQQKQVQNNTEKERNERLSWWKNDRFGLFIHWGIYSKTAGYWKGRRAKSSGHIMLYEKISVQEWGDLAKDFNPVEFDADKWVLAAKNAGMKYIVITTKHHDGLAMYNSPSSNYDLIDKSPFKRDPIKELAIACHQQGMKFGVYYSLGRDWEDPDVPTNWPEIGGRSNTWDYPNEEAKVFNTYFERKVKPQITELLTQYGTVDIMWFDTPEMISEKESIELKNLIHSYQPKCIINSRIGWKQGDYEVREQKIGALSNSPWESCVTMARHWNYDLDEKNQYKSPELLVHQLLEIVSKGGNYLLNIGPKPDGSLTEESLVRLKSIGDWMKINGNAVYGTGVWKIDHESLTEIATKRKLGDTKTGIEGKDAVNDATSKIVPAEVRFTAKGKDVYAFVCGWDKDNVFLKSLAKGENSIQSIQLLGTTKKVKWKQSKKGVSIQLPMHIDNNEVGIRCLKITLK